MNKLIFSDTSTNDTASLVISAIVFIISILVIRHVNKRRSLNTGLNSNNEALNGLVNLGMYLLMFVIVGLSFYIPSSLLKNKNTITIDTNGVEVQNLFNKTDYTWTDIQSFVIKIIPETSLSSVSKKRYHQNYTDIVTKNDSAPLCYGVSSEISALLVGGNSIDIRTDEIFQTTRGAFNVQASPIASTISQLKNLTKGNVPFTVSDFNSSYVEYTSCIQQGFDFGSVSADLKSLAK